MRTNGGFQLQRRVLSLQRRFSSGFSFQANYTLYECWIYHGYSQEAEASCRTVYNYRLDYAPDAADRTHVFNSNFSMSCLLAVGSGGYPDRTMDRLVALVCAGIFANSGLP